MYSRVKDLIDRHRLVAKGDKVLAACSGGPDSLALVHVLHRLKDEYGFSLAVAHVNHQMRGAESDADAAFVGELAASLGLPCCQGTIDVSQLIAGRCFQDAARILRYRYLRQAAGEWGGALIATGHHRGDQAETVLLNLFRGAGSAGLSGMKPTGGGIIRPLLTVSRADIDAYCCQHGLTPRLDSSNLKHDYLRNYLRLDLMPKLATTFNANITDTLCRTAEIVGDEHDFITVAARALWPTVIRDEETGLVIDCRELGKLHIALRREIVRQAIEKKRGDLKGIGFIHVEKLLKLADAGTGGAIELPGGLNARNEYGHIVLATAAAAPSGIEPPGVAVAVPGTTPVPELGIAVTARLLPVHPADAGPGSAVFAWEELTPPLFVRTRQAGDHFRPAGLAGGKKLKEYFIDAKVPRRERDLVPVFTDRQGIIWLGGMRQAQRGRPGGPTQTFLQLIIQQQED